MLSAIQHSEFASQPDDGTATLCHAPSRDSECQPACSVELRQSIVSKDDGVPRQRRSQDAGSWVGACGRSFRKGSASLWRLGTVRLTLASVAPSDPRKVLIPLIDFLKLNQRLCQATARDVLSKDSRFDLVWCREAAPKPEHFEQLPSHDGKGAGGASTELPLFFVQCRGRNLVDRCIACVCTSVEAGRIGTAPGYWAILRLSRTSGALPRLPLPTVQLVRLLSRCSRPS